MRTFGCDAPEFFCFQLEGKKKVYKIPLGTSLTNEQAKSFEQTDNKYEKEIEWLRQFIGDDIDSLTVGVTQEILKAWAEDTRNQGATVGE